MRQRTAISKGSRLAAVVCLLAVLGSACTGEGEVKAREAKPGAKTGGTLTVGVTEPLTLESSGADTFEASGNLIIRTICDPLIQIDPVTGEPKPAILDSWLTSDGGKTYFLKLRRGVRFHNGREVNADDVVFALSRVASREYGSPVATLLENVLGYEFVHGDVDVEDQDIDERFREQLAGARVVENFAFEIRINDELEQTDFFRLLSHPLASPVPKQEVLEDPDAYARRPICTGPYKLAGDWKPGDPSIRVDRFDGYYGQNLGYTRGGKGYFDSIEFRVFPDRPSQLPEFQNGNLLAAQGTPSLLISGAPVPPEQQIKATTGTLEYIGLPTATAPFNNRHFRIALSQALDRELLAQTLYAGFKTPARGYIAPTTGQLYRDQGCGDRAQTKADIPAAQESLRKSGVNLAGATFKFYFNDELGNRSMVEAIAAQWTAAFGVNFELTPMGWDEYVAKGAGQPGFDGPFRMGYAPQYPSGDTYMYPLFHSSSIGRDNLMRFSNREIDRQLKEDARTAPTDEDIRIEYQNTEDLVCEQLPSVPVFFNNVVHFLHTDRIDSASESFTDIATGQLALRELYQK
ncbi:MAG TPA: ABC transporter substrate-binding protein [Actinomycetota bacterium]|nr:ABC transporter substrate-binding protein [Actinomycetota bacterium]